MLLVRVVPRLARRDRWRSGLIILASLATGLDTRAEWSARGSSQDATVCEWAAS